MATTRWMLRALLSSVSIILVATPTSAAPDADPAGGWPLRPRPEVVRGFTPPASAWGAGHRGVDLAGSAGQAVRASAAGQVTFAGLLAGRGVVVVDHGATRTTYEPVTGQIRVGAQVGSGDRIGRLTLPGSHCFPVACLHWGWIDNVEGTYLDPLDLVGEAGVRLLPLWSVNLAPALPGSPLLRLPADFLRW